MRYFASIISLFFVSAAFSQNSPVIKINIDVIDKDSVAIPLTDYYDLTENNCATIIRYAHYNADLKQFNGPFTDVSKKDSSIIIAKGSYNDNGLKEGPFIMRFANGTVCAKGNYKQNRYDGEWTFYYPNGKPKVEANFENGAFKGVGHTFSEDGTNLLTFSADGKNCSIIDAIDKNGNKMVSNGNGYFIGDGFIAVAWRGKIVNGKPDSVWDCTQTLMNNQVFLTETFKKGIFRKGHVDYGSLQQDYTESSRINLLP